MAKNRVLAQGREITLPVPEGTVSGQALVVGKIPVVALTNRDANGKATCQRDGTWLVSVKGENAGGGSAVAVGDELFMTAGVISKIATGVHWGWAVGTVISGATTVIEAACGY